MSKSATLRKEADNESKAVLNGLRGSPIKLNYVAALIRGLRANEAVKQLTFSNRRISKDVLKCLKSAIANAENNHNLDVDSLYVTQAFVGKAMVLKRMSPRARGRSARIFKPYSNLTIIVSEEKESA
ncbi:MAG: 50S ribosomal protein L22 [Alphaproteobacteria bacterium]|nr:50S ribosomal protein L22 [Alphaproteobacteria bacterium]